MNTFISFPRIKRLFAAGACIIFAACVIVLLMLNSAMLLGVIAGWFGYDVKAESISFSPLFKSSAKNLRINGPQNSGFSMSCDSIHANTSLKLLLNGHIDTLVLDNPKLRFRIGKGKSDLSFLNQLPAITLLDIRNAEIILSFAESPKQIILKNFNIKVKNFSPAHGGDVLIESLFSFADSPQRTMSASGNFRAALKLAGAYPPYGTGTAALNLEEGSYVMNGKKISLNKVHLNADLIYDKKTDAVMLRSLSGGNKQLGSVNGSAKLVLRGMMPWSATLSISSVDFAEILALVRPVLSQEYAAWTMQGTGHIETNLSGTYAKEQLALDGTISFRFNKGGFSSADAAKAAQNISGKVILKLHYESPKNTFSWSGHSQIAGGEFLWDKYYSNLSGHEAEATMKGTFFLPLKQLELTSEVDFFGIGHTFLTFKGSSIAWQADFADTVIRNDLAVSLLMKDFLEYASPFFKDASATGTTTLSLQLKHSDEGLSAHGQLRIQETSLHMPERAVSIDAIDVQLPIWILITPQGTPVKRPDAFEHGAININGFRKGKLVIEHVSVPIAASLNYLRVSSPVTIPLFGGNVVLYRLGLDDLPHPAVGFRLGVRIENIDLGQLTKELIGDEYVGVIFADTGILRYRNDRLQGDGQFLIRVFGGEILVQNFFFEKMFSQARRIGADISFSGIDLQQVTQKVPIGHITGIIRGSLKNFVMEYGQPAHFDLSVESVDTPGVSQYFSMDAIESITVLGTGVKTSVRKGFTSLFHEFPYSKIGFTCSLRNDKFTIRGTIESGEKEYLVRRGWLRGVDIVNQNRGSTISFQDMQERLRRVMEAQRPTAAVPEIIQQ